MADRIIEMASFIKSSKNRQKVLKSMENSVKTPSDISNETDLRLNYVSMILGELKENNIVVCLNEDSKRGRFYSLTDNGEKAFKFIKQI
ncbi:winged helix-turn-helix transcriptional regulator [bacterium]|nr:winged helix-turn-helix transcriptional regulator [bacterium]